MSNASVGEGTVVNLAFRELNGKSVLHQLFKFPDGSTKWCPVEDLVQKENEADPFTTPFTERFAKTDTVPSTMQKHKTAPLTRKPINVIDDPLHPYSAETHQQLLERSARMHAALLRICGGEPSRLKAEKMKIHVKDNQSTSKDMLHIFCAAMGGEWEDLIEDIY